MAVHGEFTFEGGAEVAALLSALPDRLANNMMRGAMRAGAAFLRDAIRANAPIGSPPLPRREKAGDLRRSITASARRTGDQIIGVVSIHKFYWRFVEYGTKTTSAVRGIFTRGHRGHHHTRAYPFVRPAWDHNREAAVGRVVEYARVHLESAVADQGIYLQGFGEAA